MPENAMFGIDGGYGVWCDQMKRAKTRKWRTECNSVCDFQKYGDERWDSIYQKYFLGPGTFPRHDVRDSHSMPSPLCSRDAPFSQCVYEYLSSYAVPGTDVP
eukprot:2876808-Rhodomonas_salina.2